MAVCEYKAIVKGKKNACYAFCGSSPALEGVAIYDEHGSDSTYEMTIGSVCKYAVDAYCEPWTEQVPVSLPEDTDEAYDMGDRQYSFRTVRDRSRMFAVEVLCTSADIDDFDPEEGPAEKYEHYIDGEVVNDTCPDNLHIEVEADPWDD